MDGVEFSPEVIKKLSEKIKSSFFYAVDTFRDSNTKYGVIRLSNVLEHFTSPRVEFQNILEHLQEGGIVLLEGPLEFNSSMVNWFKWNYLRLRKLLNKDFVTTHSPNHIFFSNYKNQLNFFESSGLKTICYKVKENAWPYPEHLYQVNTPGNLFKYLIGRFSRFIGTFKPRYGNTFLYVGQKG
jgi:SAM-dependent methyltransferase